MYLCEYDTGTIKKVEKETENKNRRVLKTYQASTEVITALCVHVCMRQTVFLCCVCIFLFSFGMWLNICAIIVFEVCGLV